MGFWSSVQQRRRELDEIATERIQIEWRDELLKRWIIYIEKVRKENEELRWKLQWLLKQPGYQHVVIEMGPPPPEPEWKAP